MRPAYTHIASRARQIIALLCITLSLSAQDFSADRDLFDAYMKEDMTVWKAYVDSLPPSSVSFQTLLYEYGFCGFIVANDKPHALPYVKQFRQHIEAVKAQLPKGYYEMYMSAVYVFELRLHESIHPIKSMSLAKEATRLAPNDPIILSYYGTCLFYAPKPFGDKREALEWFEKADILFRATKWKYCWLKEANSMYIQQCLEKLNP